MSKRSTLGLGDHFDTFVAAQVDQGSCKAIDSIWTDTATHWGVDQAEIYIRQIARTLETNATIPR